MAESTLAEGGAMSLSRLRTSFPSLTWPLIGNGPMIGAACPSLAAAVSQAGGLGFLPSAFDLQPDSPHLGKLEADLTECRRLLGHEVEIGDGPLPVGVGFITSHPSVGRFEETVLPIIAKHRPAAVWLFAPDEELKPHEAMIRALRSLDSPPCVFVQVGNVKAAREAVRDGADAIVCQGIDAGGHQFRRGAGVISLVPEVRQMLDQEQESWQHEHAEEPSRHLPPRELAVFAAGGIADGKGVAAMMALGADGVVMGTRFTVAQESVYPDFRKKLVLETSDGGNSTLKSPLHDQLARNQLWGSLYDGRAIVGPIQADYLAGSTTDECQKRLDEHEPEARVKLIGNWAGTGVGLVQRSQAAGDIVREVRKEAVERIRALAAGMG